MMGWGTSDCSHLAGQGGPLAEGTDRSGAFLSEERWIRDGGGVVVGFFGFVQVCQDAK